MKLALKVDVTTLSGTREGVPRLAKLFERHAAGATFFFCVGPDHSRFTRFLPGPDIGRRAGDIMRAVRDAGFETALQAWDAGHWIRRVAVADNSWTETQLELAVEGYARIFGERPFAHAAPGWQTNAHALRMTQRLGFDYCSDGRGRSPHLPVRNAELVLCPQFPTSLPTLDELAGARVGEAEHAALRLLERTATDRAPMHVFTLRAERDGRSRMGLVDALLSGWRAQGHELVALRTLFDSVEPMQLPRCTVTLGVTAGCAEPFLVQGSEFLARGSSGRARKR